MLAPATLAALPSTRAIPDRDVFYVAHPIRSILNLFPSLGGVHRGGGAFPFRRQAGKIVGQSPPRRVNSKGEVGILQTTAQTLCRGRQVFPFSSCLCQVVS